MKILKISGGLPPSRSGGAPAYILDLRQELTRRGHQIVYLDSDNQDASRKAKIVQTSEQPEEHAFYNSGVRLPWSPPRQSPLRDIFASTTAAQCLLDFVESQKPDVIHIHELLSFPLELVSVLASAGWKVLFTAHDYFSICPTVQMLRNDLKICTLRTGELECRQCVSALPNAYRSAPGEKASELLIKRGRADAAKWLRRFDTICGRVIGRGIHGESLYRERRAKALTHLKSFQAILCISKAQLELMSEVTEGLSNLRQIYLSRKSYGNKVQRAPVAHTSGPPRFVGLNINQPNKGRQLLLREFGEFRKEMPAATLDLFGGPKATQPGVVSHGSYSSDDLASILACADAGILPSIWPETYGYVGPEMLSHGVPVIASSAGAMKEYVIHDFNGLIFDPSKPGSLKDAMKTLALDRDLLARLKANAANSTQGIISFSNHVDEMEAIYAEVSIRSKKMSFDSEKP